MATDDAHGSDDPQDADNEPVGSLGEEAVKLLGVLGDWARDQGTDLGSGVAAAAGHASQAAGQAEEHLATGAAECTWCPVCRTVHALRQTNPEVRDQLVVAATALLQAGTGFLATLQAGPHPGPGEQARGHRPDGREGVEHIDLTDAPGDDDDEWES